MHSPARGHSALQISICPQPWSGCPLKHLEMGYEKIKGTPSTAEYSGDHVWAGMVSGSSQQLSHGAKLWEQHL